MSNYQSIYRINVITIAGQYGSGCDEIAVQLARKLRWRLFDHEINARVASEADLSEEDAAGHDEHTYGVGDQFLNAMAFSAVDLWPCVSDVPLLLKTQERLYDKALQKIIEDIAYIGNAVIVGRGSQVLLEDQQNVLHIRVVAPLVQRVRHVTQLEELDENHARAVIQQKDQDLAYYHKTRHRRDVNDPLLYDLVVNGGALDLQSQIDLICLALKCKALQLVPVSPDLTPAQSVQQSASESDLASTLSL